MDRAAESSRYHAILLAALGVFILRALTLGAYPLMDTTEARYAEIARKMVELNDWITPWFSDGVPFWGKPPLSFWLTALSLKLFGNNEIAARLPHWLLGVGVAVFIWHLAAQRSAKEAAYATAILLGSGLFLLASGGVMTDMALTFGIVISFSGFWLSMYGTKKQKARQRWLFFIGAALGMLAKGPVAIVLIAMPLFIWTVYCRRGALIWHNLPWIRGLILIAAIAGPWYVIAERQTPGFLNYFFIGEHWQRFVTPGWSGDLYGSAHDYPRGTIWLFAWTDWLPWSLLLPIAAVFWRMNPVDASNENSAITTARDWQVYLVCWGLAPCMFFTFAGNILWAYVLPGMPALALLAASWLARYPDQDSKRLLAAGLIITGIAYLAMLSYLHVSHQVERKSAKNLVFSYQNAAKAGQQLVIFSNARLYSAAFYSRGAAEQVNSTAALKERLAHRPAMVAVDFAYMAEFLTEFQGMFEPCGTFGQLVLFAPVNADNEIHAEK